MPAYRGRTAFAWLLTMPHRLVLAPAGFPTAREACAEASRRVRETMTNSPNTSLPPGKAQSNTVPLGRPRHANGPLAHFLPAPSTSCHGLRAPPWTHMSRWVPEAEAQVRPSIRVGTPQPRACSKPQLRCPEPPSMPGLGQLSSRLHPSRLPGRKEGGGEGTAGPARDPLHTWSWG